MDGWVLEFTFLQAVPPPGSYDVDLSYRHTQLKQTPAPPRNDAAAKRKEAFASSSSRFAPPRDIVIKKADSVNPGLYRTIKVHYNYSNPMVKLRGRLTKGQLNLQLSLYLEHTILWWHHPSVLRTHLFWGFHLLLHNGQSLLKCPSTDINESQYFDINNHNHYMVVNYGWPSL